MIRCMARFFLLLYGYCSFSVSFRPMKVRTGGVQNLYKPLAIPVYIHPHQQAKHSLVFNKVFLFTRHSLFYYSLSRSSTSLSLKVFQNNSFTSLYYHHTLSSNNHQNDVLQDRSYHDLLRCPLRSPPSRHQGPQHYLHRQW